MATRIHLRTSRNNSIYPRSRRCVLPWNRTSSRLVYFFFFFFFVSRTHTHHLFSFNLLSFIVYFSFPSSSLFCPLPPFFPRLAVADGSKVDARPMDRSRQAPFSIGSACNFEFLCWTIGTGRLYEFSATIYIFLLYIEPIPGEFWCF